MKKFIILGVLLLWAGSASAAVITGLHTTGENPTSPSGTLFDSNYYLNDDESALAYMVSPELDGGWVKGNWISVNSAGSEGASGASTTTYSTNFSVSGYDGNVASLSSTLAWDDLLSVTLNGYTIYSSSLTSWGSYTNLLFDISAYLSNGENVLSFIVQNTGNYATGLNVASLTGTYSTPAPAAILLLGSGCLGIIMRKKFVV